ncbi:CinA family protein [Agrococcus sp. SL85]|uniref:CinA family protein n=1 Tax=Agrococcus sp. SL85 TaxID=2995141 RepID=UPI00226D1762|nr:CinA family protein [Agrococcus sp. SL85]WAC66265.1 CinA family protein [Agrococcus sp. SL85]
MTEHAGVEALAERAVLRAIERGATLAVAESLTGGALAAALVGVPGASAVLRLGVVAYATEMKGSVLHVPAALLRERGPVDPEVAVAMARGARELAAIDRAACTIGVATTGVAGPDPQDGHAPGEFHVGLEARVATGRAVSAASRAVDGDRSAVREAAVRAALELLLEALDRDDLAPDGPHSGSTP